MRVLTALGMSAWVMAFYAAAGYPAFVLYGHRLDWIWVKRGGGGMVDPRQEPPPNAGPPSDRVARRPSP